MTHNFINVDNIINILVESSRMEGNMLVWKNGSVSDSGGLFVKSTTIIEEGYYHNNSNFVKDLEKWKNDYRIVTVGEKENIECWRKASVKICLSNENYFTYWFESDEKAFSFASIIRGKMSKYVSVINNEKELIVE